MCVHWQAMDVITLWCALLRGPAQTDGGLTTLETINVVVVSFRARLFVLVEFHDTCRVYDFILFFFSKEWLDASRGLRKLIFKMSHNSSDFCVWILLKIWFEFWSLHTGTTFCDI